MKMKLLLQLFVELKKEYMENDIIDMQIKLTHQEDLLDQLNQIVTKQQFTIDKLVKEVTELKLTSISGQTEVGNEKPPHY